MSKLTLEQLHIYANQEFGGPSIGAWPTYRGGKLKPHMGGGGGGGDGGAQAMENQRQARIKAATDTINNVFNNQVQNPDGTWSAGDPANDRSTMYNNQRNAIYDLNSQEVNRQAAVAQRNNNFGLARSGLAGGSADVDSNAELNRITNQGLLQAGGVADQSAADLQSADEKTRANLISMAQSGIDTGTAASMALNGLQTDANQAAAQRGGATIGNLFNGLSQAYLVNQQNNGLATANGYGNTYGLPSQFYGSQTIRSGGSQGV